MELAVVAVLAGGRVEHLATDHLRGPHQLQLDGVKTFAESYDQLIQTLESRRKALAGV